MQCWKKKVNIIHEFRSLIRSNNWSVEKYVLVNKQKKKYWTNFKEKLIIIKIKMIFLRSNLPSHASFDVVLPPDQTHPCSIFNQSPLHLSSAYEIFICLKWKSDITLLQSSRDFCIDFTSLYLESHRNDSLNKLLISSVVFQNNSHRFFVVSMNNCSESLLHCCIPNSIPIPSSFPYWILVQYYFSLV